MAEEREINLIERVQRTERAISSLTGRGLGSVVGGGVEPTLAIADLIGSFVKLHPVVTGAALTIGALGAAAKIAANTLTEVGQTSLATGGTAGQIGQLGGIFSALGLSTGAIAGTARALRESVAGGGLGALAGAQLGVPIAPVGVGRPPNEARMLLQASESLRRMTEEQARLTTERLPVLQPFASLRFLDDAQMDRFRELGQQMDDLATPQAIAQAQMFNAEMAVLQKQLTMLAVEIGSTVLPVVNKLIEGLHSFGSVTDFVRVLAGDPFGALGSFVGRSMFGGGREKSAEEEQTEALQRNTQALEFVGKGLYGAGARGGAAIPAGLTGDAFARGMRVDAIRLGAY